jgi:hypothetical protein
MATTRCYTALDVMDRDQPNVDQYLRRRLSHYRPPIMPCRGARPSLAVGYQAGRGVCIDCDQPGPGWSGFAFVVIYDDSGNEIESFEWQGSGGLNGRVLVEAFAQDLEKLLSRQSLK